MEHPIFQLNLLKILLQLATPRILLALLFHWLKANLLSLKSLLRSAYPNPVIGMDYPSTPIFTGSAALQWLMMMILLLKLLLAGLKKR